MSEIEGISNYNPFGIIGNCNPAGLQRTTWEKVAERTLRDRGYEPDLDLLLPHQKEELIGIVAGVLKRANGNREKPFPDALTNPSSSYKRFQWTQCPRGVLSWLPPSGAAPGIILPEATICHVVNDYLEKNTTTPEIMKITPERVEPGKTVTLLIMGKNFGFSPTITVDSEFAQRVPDPRNLSINPLIGNTLQVITLKISENTLPGTQIPIKIERDKKSDTKEITVLGPQYTPPYVEKPLARLSITPPPIVIQGRQQTFTITGGQYFEEGETTVRIAKTPLEITTRSKVVDHTTIEVTVATTPQPPLDTFTLIIETRTTVKDEEKREIRMITETGSVEFKVVQPEPAKPAIVEPKKEAQLKPARPKVKAQPKPARAGEKRKKAPARGKKVKQSSGEEKPAKAEGFCDKHPDDQKCQF